MAHARQTIREAVVSYLTGLPTTGAYVHDTRFYNHDVLPCLTVFADNDSVDDELGTRTSQVRNLTIRVEVRAKGTSGIENTIDTICAEVEAAIYDDATLGGIALDTSLDATVIEYSVEQDQPIALALMSFNVDYVVAPGVPTTII